MRPLRRTVETSCRLISSCASGKSAHRMTRSSWSMTAMRSRDSRTETAKDTGSVEFGDRELLAKAASPGGTRSYLCSLFTASAPSSTERAGALVTRAPFQVRQH